MTRVEADELIRRRDEHIKHLETQNAELRQEIKTLEERIRTERNLSEELKRKFNTVCRRVESLNTRVVDLVEEFITFDPHFHDVDYGDDRVGQPGGETLLRVGSRIGPPVVPGPKRSS